MFQLWNIIIAHNTYLLWGIGFFLILRIIIATTQIQGILLLWGIKHKDCKDVRDGVILPFVILKKDFHKEG